MGILIADSVGFGLRVLLTKYEVSQNQKCIWKFFLFCFLSILRVIAYTNQIFTHNHSAKPGLTFSSKKVVAIQPKQFKNFNEVFLFLSTLPKFEVNNTSIGSTKTCNVSIYHYYSFGYPDWRKQGKFHPGRWKRLRFFVTLQESCVKTFAQCYSNQETLQSTQDGEIECNLLLSILPIGIWWRASLMSGSEKTIFPTKNSDSCGSACKCFVMTALTWL